MTRFRIPHSVTTILLAFAASALAQNARIEGTAMGIDGKPANNTQVRIQSEKGSVAPVVVKTDAKGHFAAGGLKAGNYNVSVVGKGAVASAKVMVRGNQTAQVNLGRGGASAVAKKQERWVWVPSGTGSHMGGHYEKVNDNGTTTNTSPNAQNVDTMGGSQLTRLQQQGNVSRGGGTP